MQDVGGCQAAVTSDDDEVIDALLDEVLRRLQASFAGAEFVASRGADDGPTLLHDAADCVPVHFLEVVAAVHQPAVALADGHHLDAEIEGRAHCRADGGIHAGRITTAGENGQSFRSLVVFSHFRLLRFKLEGAFYAKAAKAARAAAMRMSFFTGVSLPS